MLVASPANLHLYNYPLHLLILQSVETSSVCLCSTKEITYECVFSAFPHTPSYPLCEPHLKYIYMNIIQYINQIWWNRNVRHCISVYFFLLFFFLLSCRFSSFGKSFVRAACSIVDVYSYILVLLAASYPKSLLLLPRALLVPSKCVVPLFVSTGPAMGNKKIKEHELMLEWWWKRRGLFYSYTHMSHHYTMSDLALTAGFVISTWQKIESLGTNHPRKCYGLQCPPFILVPSVYSFVVNEMIVCTS